MSPRIEIRVDHMALELGPLPGGDAAKRALVERALERLAERLSGSPLAHSGRPFQRALERLSTSGLSEDELTGPRGAEALADELYTELTRRLG